MQAFRAPTCHATCVNLVMIADLQKNHAPVSVFPPKAQPEPAEGDCWRPRALPDPKGVSGSDAAVAKTRKSELTEGVSTGLTKPVGGPKEHTSPSMVHV